jgi:hypothetical protein
MSVVLPLRVPLQGGGGFGPPMPPLAGAPVPPSPFPGVCACVFVHVCVRTLTLVCTF